MRHVKQAHRIDAIKGREVESLSKNANVRCLDCGWKYNFTLTPNCPVCASERTYLLSNGTFLNSIFTIALVFAIFAGVLVLAYKALTS